MRQLSLFFGSDVYAAAITLSVFMGGLSLGSAIAERLVDKLKRPLLCYGLIEIAVGIYAFFFRDFLVAFAPILERVYRVYFEAAPITYQSVRIGVAALALLPPTILMGSTLPLVVKSFVQRDTELGRFSGTFYAINTLGALVGTLFAAFALMPFLGVGDSTRVAVAINVVIGTLVILVSPKVKTQRASIEEGPSGEKPVTAEELSKAGANLIRGYAQKFEAVDRIGGEVGTLWTLGMPMSELERVPDELGKSSLDAVRAVAAKYAMPKNSMLLLVGDLSRVEPGVREVVKGEIVLLDAEGKPVKK